MSVPRLMPKRVPNAWINTRIVLTGQPLASVIKTVPTCESTAKSLVIDASESNLETQPKIQRMKSRLNNLSFLFHYSRYVRVSSQADMAKFIEEKKAEIREKRKAADALKTIKAGVGGEDKAKEEL